MDVLGFWELQGACFEVYRYGNGFRFFHVPSGVSSVEMPYHEVVRVLVVKQYQPIAG